VIAARGLDPKWSRFVPVPDADGVERIWHVLDTCVEGPWVEAGGSLLPTGTLLCVHGNPTWSYLWRRLLAAAPPGWRVLAVDQLGMGWSERLPGRRTLAQRVDDLGRLTQALGITGPVVTVAHDWGGPVSLGWALDHREQVRGVVLTNTAVHQPAGSAGPLLIRAAHLPGVRDLTCVRTPTFVRAATALSSPRLPSDVRDAYSAPYGTAERRRAVGDFVADIPFTPGHPSAATVDAIAEGVRALDVPALLLWGPRDPVFGEAHLRDLRQRLPHAQVHRYEGASHLLPEDAPQYAEDIVAWLDDVVTLSAPHGASVVPSASQSERPLWARIEARRDDRSPALVEVGGITVSWAQLHHRVRALAGGLVRAGLRPGDRVALLVPPSAELTAAVYAAWRAGGVVVVADQGLGLRGMGRALRAASVDFVIGTAKGLAAARAMRLPGRMVAVGPRRGLRLPFANLFVSELVREGVESPLPSVQADADCAVVFTSGATGPAKGVAYRHHQVQAQVDLLRRTYDLEPADRLVAAFAPFAIYGPALGVASCVPDVNVTAPGTLTAGALAEAAAAVDSTVVFASPAALRNVVATSSGLAAHGREALSRVRLLMSAGAPVPVELLREVSRLMPAASAHTPYGMTEALPVTDVSLPEIEAAGEGNGVCVGVPLPGVQVQVSPLSPSGTADGSPTAKPFVTGEIAVSAPHVKDRYDALWATQRRSAREPGWHRTGDVGHFDDAGRLWVEGRLVHVVTTPDGVVTPVGAERRVERLDGVRAAAVVGVGPVGAQAVVVVVVPEGRSSRGPVADLALTDRVRAVAGTEVAAVLVRRNLPVDIRHASKVDRLAVAAWAEKVLAGG
jgi:acyl-coenzyme A synthetase/AMP-(fatty) acid ligase/pimeloyl-ACP methyl ester carboxylesterase